MQQSCNRAALKHATELQQNPYAPASNTFQEAATNTRRELQGARLAGRMRLHDTVVPSSGLVGQLRSVGVEVSGPRPALARGSQSLCCVWGGAPDHLSSGTLNA
jgi:hypothetical protein